jgi:integration host factor subunit alpha
MTRADLIEVLQAEAQLGHAEASRIVECFFAAMADALARGEPVRLARLGSLEVRAKRARRGRNPQTGEAMEISARRVLSFRPSRVLVEALAAASSGGPPGAEAGAADDDA